jgi:hypothetical protein
MKIGAHSWLLETRYPLPQAMAEARRIGYDGYEMELFPSSMRTPYGAAEWRRSRPASPSRQGHYGVCLPPRATVKLVVGGTGMTGQRTLKGVYF